MTMSGVSMFCVSYVVVIIINNDFILLDSVSDLLDYINPNQDGNKRDAEAVKRKNLGTKVWQVLFQDAFKCLNLPLLEQIFIFFKGVYQ